jgi:hypothetical protein
MHELIIELVETKNGNFNKITCNEGHWITSWNEGDDILEFNASKVICCPLKVEIETTYRCIDNETYEVLEKQRDEAEKKRMEEEEKNRMNMMNK